MLCALRKMVENGVFGATPLRPAAAEPGATAGAGVEVDRRAPTCPPRPLAPTLAVPRIGWQARERVILGVAPCVRPCAWPPCPSTVQQHTLLGPKASRDQAAEEIEPSAPAPHLYAIIGPPVWLTSVRPSVRPAPAHLAL